MPTVIVINYVRELLEELTETLELHGFDVINCRSSEEAMDELKANEQVGCILCELFLPRIDGWKLCRLLKNHEIERLREIPILLYSHLLGGETATEISYQSGARSYFTIPTLPANLVEQVHHAMEGSRAFHRDRVEVVTRSKGQLVPLLSQLDPLRFYSQTVTPEESTASAQLSLVAPDVTLEELRALPLWAPSQKGDRMWLAVKTHTTSEVVIPYLDAGFDAVVRADNVKRLAQLIEQCKKQKAIIRVRQVELEKQERASKARRSTGRILNLFRDSP